MGLTVVGLTGTGRESPKTAKRQAFGAWAQQYHSLRPGYPVAALDYLADRARGLDGLCADIGAGTGLLTGGLRDRGIEVVGVEPDSRMRAVLAEIVGASAALEGTAESLPFPEASVGMITAGQMWHWVDREASAAEAARVLKPGGELAICWSLRDDRQEWVAELAELVGLSDLYSTAASDRPLRLGNWFEVPTLKEFEFTISLDVEGMVEQIGTYAAVATRPDSKNRLDLARSYLNRTFGDAELFTAPFICKVYVARRR